MKNNLNKYIDYLRTQRNYSENTIDAYLKDIKIWKDFLSIEALDYLDIEYSDIRLFFSFLEKCKYSKSSIARIISSLRSFYRFLLRNNKVDNNPFNLVKAPKKDKKLPKFLYYNELEQLFMVPDMNDPFGQRDRVILELLYATGMRVGELELLKVSDIDMNEKKIKVFGKGSKERIVYFGEPALEALKIYLNDGRKKIIKNKDFEFLLVNNKKTYLQSRGIRDILDNIIKKSSLDTKISPHTLRHTFATHLLNEGCDILTVQELLGHESLRATQIYTHITDEKLRNVYFKAHPRNKKHIDGGFDEI